MHFKILKSTVSNLDKLNSIKENYNLASQYVVNKVGVIYKIKEELDKHYLVSEMKPFINNDGYVEYVLTNKDKVKKHIMGHIAVCGVYTTKPKSKDFVNHKDGVRDNNNVNNLEWSTTSENLKHSYDKLNRKPTNHHIKAKESKV